MYRVLTLKPAVPLSDPESFFDDWHDPEVDGAYAGPRR